MKKQQSWRKIFLFPFTLTLSLFLFTKCMPIDDNNDDNIGEPQLTFSEEGDISFGEEGGTKTVNLTTNREWSVSKGTDASWVKISPKNGVKGDATITVEVESNKGKPRKCSLIITAASIDRAIIVTQNGKGAPQPEYTTIQEIRNMYAESGMEEWIIEKPLQLKGVVISDRVGANRPSQRDGFIQDSAGDGLAFRVKQSNHSFDLGDELTIDLEGATLLYYGGILQINFSTKAVKVDAKNISVAPKELTIEEILNGAYDGTLVKINGVQFETYEQLNFYEKGIATNRILENCDGDNIIVRTIKYASFKDEALPTGNGGIVGIVSLNNGSWQLLIRNIEDVKEMSNDESTRCISSYITTDKTVVAFDSEGGYEVINIAANVDWTASSNEDWLTIVPESGSNDGLIVVIANKNEGEERKSVITITDGTDSMTVLVSQKAKEATAEEEEEEKEEITDVASDLFFSEYIEGSSNNKYLEIYNGTGATVDLSDYRIELYVNGQAKAKTTEILTGKLNNGEVVVYKHSKATIYDGEATVSTAINFNGNDAIALVKISTEAYVDIFGCIGHDPGKAWTKSSSDFSITTMDKTLVRKPSVRGGVAANPKNGFPTLSSEWIAYPIDTADYLGSHTMD